MLTIAPPRGPLPPRARRLAGHPLAVPVLAALMIALLGTQIALVFKVPSWGNDEPAHVGYVAALAEGRLPTIDTAIVDDPARFPGTAEELRGWDDAHGDIWTANHPPLFHLAMVPVWWALSDIQGPDGGQSGMVIAMRLANTAGFALWLLLVGLVARELVPRRPAVTALAVVVAMTPTLVLRSAFFINDGWASSAALLLLLATVRMLRDRITPARLAWATAAGTAAAGFRAQGVLVVALCAVALALTALHRAGWLRAGWRGWRRALAVGGLVGGVPALAWGWFYLRNLRLYGDLTGQDALLEKFEREPVDGLAGIVHVPGLTEPTLATPIVLVAAVVLVPVALVGTVRRHGLRFDAAWTLLGVHAALTAQSVVSFIAHGGGFHDRYLMQAMPLLATATAIGMLEVARWLPAPAEGTATSRRSREWWTATAWAAVLLAWLAVALWWLERYYVFTRQSTSPVDGPLPVLLVVLASGVGALLLATMAGRAIGAAGSGAGSAGRASAPPASGQSAESAL
ncbi:hypothetical protein [Nocardioides sp. YIM 152588]|uniref:hypothetical protein n=1 Tax=Nocardioides sp. YIM 152588 TaxID=3158259 RepID=UPI0032E4E40A